MLFIPLFSNAKSLSWENAQGDLNGFYSYRLNQRDRIVHEIYEEDKVVLVVRAKTHYGD